MLQFLHKNDNSDAKAITIPPVFSENSQAKNYRLTDGPTDRPTY